MNASTSTDENDAIDVEMQCDMLFIVASLCEGDTHRKVKLWSVIEITQQMLKPQVEHKDVCVFTA